MGGAILDTPLNEPRGIVRFYGGLLFYRLLARGVELCPRYKVIVE